MIADEKNSAKKAQLGRYLNHVYNSQVVENISN
jgi:hypothetical protein